MSRSLPRDVRHERLLDFKKDPRLLYGMLFKNVGAAAGASLERIRSQFPLLL